MRGSVIAVASGKGGVGKSTTALNLGIALPTDSVVIVDADLGMANIGAMLEVHTDPTLHDVLAGQADIESAIVTEYEAADVVPGGRNLRGYAEADPGRLPGVLATLAEQYEYVVVDAGAGLGYADVVPVEAADEVILTTTPTGAAIGDTAKLVTFSERVDTEVRGVVVTRADEETDAEVIATKVGTEPLGVIPDDPNVEESIDAGLPLELYAPDSPAGVAYSRLGDVISGRSEPYIGDAVEYPGDTQEDPGDTQEDETDGVPESPEQSASLTEEVEVSSRMDRTPARSNSPGMNEPPGQDSTLEPGSDSVGTMGSDSVGTMAEDDSEDESGGGLLARLRSLL